MLNRLNWYVQLKLEGNAQILMELHSQLLLCPRSRPSIEEGSWGLPDLVVLVESREIRGTLASCQSSPVCWLTSVLSEMMFSAPLHWHPGTQCYSMQLVSWWLFFRLGNVPREHGPFLSWWLSLLSAFIVSRLWFNPWPLPSPWPGSPWPAHAT